MDPQRGVAFECRHLNLVTQRKLGEGNENDTVKVIAIAFEELVCFYRQYNVEIALRPTRTPRVAFTLIANAGSIFDASRHADADGMAAVSKPGTIALQTRMGNHLPRPVADRTSASNGEKTLLVTNLSAAIALLTGLGPATGRRPGSPALGAHLSAADLDFCLLAESSFFKLQREIVANVAAALYPSIATVAAHVEHLPEEVSEDISHVSGGKSLETGSTRAADSGVSVTIVGSALLRIREHLVCFARLLELLFRLRIIRVAVGMKLHRQAPVGGLQLLIVAVARDAEKFVVFDFGHFGCWAHASFCCGLFTTRTRAGRSRRSRIRYPRRTSSSTWWSGRSVRSTLSSASWTRGSKRAPTASTGCTLSERSTSSICFTTSSSPLRNCSSEPDDFRAR